MAWPPIAAQLSLEIDKRQFLTGAVGRDKAGLQFLDGPGRREAACHSPSELLCNLIAVLGHAAGIDGYCVLSWSPDRCLVARRKIVLDFTPAHRLIGRKLLRIERPSIDAAKRRLW